MKLIKRFLLTLFTLFILAAALYAMDYYFKIFAIMQNYFHRYLSTANGILFGKMVLGISAGTCIFIIILLIYPVFSRKIDTRSYFTNLYKGIISSFIFFVSDSIYNYLAKISKFYLLISIIAVSMVTLYLINIAAKMYKKKEEQVEFRTAYIASITAGLIFAVLLQLFTLGLDIIKSYLLSICQI